MNSAHRPHGTKLNWDQREGLARRDIRKGFDDRRLLWQDAVRLQHNNFMVINRFVERGQISSGSCPLTQASRVYLRGYGWKTANAFEPDSVSSSLWKRQEISDVEVRLADFRPIIRLHPSLLDLGLPIEQGQNRILHAKWREKHIFVPTLSLILALLAPSELVFSQFAHPMASRFYARRQLRDGELEVRATTHSLTCLSLDRWDLCCLAYWLRSEPNVLASANLYNPVFARTNFEVPADTGKLSLNVDAYECDDLIVVQSIGQSVHRSIWPLEPIQVIVSNLSGRPIFHLGVGPERISGNAVYLRDGYQI
ncbi:MAG: hypothetical protein WCH35_10975 [Comamonadaceae bacterium]